MRITTAAALGTALALAALLFPAAPEGRGAPPPSLSTLASLPVREVTVFKDGHAFVVHGGTMPVDGEGNVVLDTLPSPVMGTFWPFSADPGVPLAGVVAGKRRVLVPRTALDVPSLIRANPGAEVWIREKNGSRYPATLLEVPTRTTEELERTTPPGEVVAGPEHASVVLLRTAEGTKVLPLERIEEVVFRNGMERTLAGEEQRDLLTMHLDWGGRAPAPAAEVGMGYLQKGLRWIPSYRVEIDGEGKASLRLQGTLLNELTDLENVTVHLVIGVPNFDFRETPDPVGLQRSLAPLSRYFRTDPASGLSNGALASNFVATQQVARAGEYRERAPAESGGSGEGDTGKTEDLYVFTIEGVSLARGERMVLPVADAELPYEDVHALDLPFSPPPEIRHQIDRGRHSALKRLLLAPRPTHRLRIENSGTAPLTTAPALVLREGSVLGQGTMTYTAPGATVDLDVTAAVDVRVRKEDRETGRVIDAVQWNGHSYHRVDLEGSVVLTNTLDVPVKVEVVRWVFGAVDEAGQEGTVTAVNLHEDGEWSDWRPAWWGWYSWPSWWVSMNGVGRVSWTVTVEPGKSETLTYGWHYFWR